MILSAMGVLVFGGLSVFLWQPRAMTLGCGIVAFVALSVVISIVLLFIPVLGFIIDAMYWLAVCFAGMCYLLFLASRRPSTR